MPGTSAVTQVNSVKMVEDNGGSCAQYPSISSFACFFVHPLRPLYTQSLPTSQFQHTYYRTFRSTVRFFIDAFHFISVMFPIFKLVFYMYQICTLPSIERFGLVLIRIHSHTYTHVLYVYFPRVPGLVQCTPTIVSVRL